MSGGNMTFGGHALLGKIAFATLPAWEKDLFSGDIPAAKTKHPCIPQEIKTVAERAGIMCNILDWIYYDEFRPYAVMPDGRWIPHSPPDGCGQSCAGSGQPKSNLVLLGVLEWLLSRMLKAAEDKEWEEVLRRGGALGHFLQEPFTPGHAVPNRLFADFFPDPDPERHIRLHHKFDAATDDFSPRPPKLLGTTIQEAAFRLLIEVNKGIAGGTRLLGKLIQSAYNDEPDENRRKILAEQCRHAAFATASAWHTVLSIACSKLAEKEVEVLSNIELTEIIPYFVHHSQYVDMLPGCLVKNGFKAPITVHGYEGEEHIEKGFGMTGHMGMKFFVNGDIYTRFKCRAGLPSRHTEGQTENTDTIFFVETDEEENSVYSEDMEYKARRAASVSLQPGKPARDIDVSIRGARSLILGAQSKPYVSNGGRVKFDIPHIAVCEPVLLKN